MRYSFDTYKPITPSQEHALEVSKKVSRLAVINYTADKITHPALVVLSGKPGVGKTHLLEAIKGELDENGVQYHTFSSQIPHTAVKMDKKIIIGDDAFSKYDKLSGQLGMSSWSELIALNDHLLNQWYPKGSLVVMTSNFDLATIQQSLEVADTIGRASSRLSEMALRGADIPIVGEDFRNTGQIESLF